MRARAPSWTRAEPMRDTFVRTLERLAASNRHITLITGDLGFGVLDRFASQYPAQYINAGVAEQNMTGVAAGMALEGKTVFTYSIANFPTLRCLEQIRNDVAYHDANVKIVAIGGGFSYGALGMSHHATEDIAILRALPNVRVYAPCDETETTALTLQLAQEHGPAYFRLDKSKASVEAAAPFEANKLRCLRQGADVTIVGYGGILDEAMKASAQLQGLGIQCGVYSAHTLKPFDTATLRWLVASVPVLVTLEEHVATGGIASLVAQELLAAGLMPRTWCPIALPDAYSSIVGSQDYLRTRHDMDANAIFARIRKLLGR